MMKFQIVILSCCNQVSNPVVSSNATCSKNRAIQMCSSYGTIICISIGVSVENSVKNFNNPHLCWIVIVCLSLLMHVWQNLKKSSLSSFHRATLARDRERNVTPFDQLRFGGLHLLLGEVVD